MFVHCFSKFFQSSHKAKARCGKLLEGYHKPCLTFDHEVYLRTYPLEFGKFPTGVSPKVQPNSMQVIFSSIIKLDTTSNLIKEGYLTEASCLN